MAVDWVCYKCGAQAEYRSSMRCYCVEHWRMGDVKQDEEEEAHLDGARDTQTV